MDNFASLERTMPPVVFEAPDGFSIRQPTEDLYIEGVAAGLESIQQEPTDTMAERAAKRQREIEESLNPAISMFWTEFE